jgi:Ca-activated chloride channel homolog
MIQFGSPNFLWLLALGPLLVLFFRWRWKKQQSLLNQFADSALVQKLLEGFSPSRIRWKMILAALAVGLLGLALSRPQYGVVEQIVKRRGMDIVIAIDTSDSMLAEDLRPNRLMVAKKEISALIDRLDGDRIAIVPFAGDAFVQCPLTLDYAAAKMFLQEIDVNTVSRPGSALGRAIEVASRCFVQEERQYKLLILITDGEDTSGRPDPMEVSAKAAKEGVRIFTIGVGSRGGAPIPVRDDEGNIAGYKQDRQGNKVISRLDETMLRDIALESQGTYFRAAGQNFELDRIYDEINEMEEKQLHSRIYTQGIDRFQYVILPVILLLLLEFLLPCRIRKKGENTP